MSNEESTEEVTEKYKPAELKKDRYREFAKAQIMQIDDSDYYYKITGQKFAKQVLKESSEALIVGLIGSLLFEFIVTYKLDFSFIESDYSIQFLTLITLGIYCITKYTRYEDTDIFSLIYGEEYASLRTLIEDTETIESLEILELNSSLNPFAILGYFLVQSRKLSKISKA